VLLSKHWFVFPYKLSIRPLSVQTPSLLPPPIPKFSFLEQEWLCNTGFSIFVPQAFLHMLDTTPPRYLAFKTPRLQRPPAIVMTCRYSFNPLQQLACYYFFSPPHPKNFSGDQIFFLDKFPCNLLELHLYRLSDGYLFCRTCYGFFFVVRQPALALGFLVKKSIVSPVTLHSLL